MNELEALWQNIASAGSIDSYIHAQLVEHGFLVERKATDEMSKRQKDRYKKALKAGRGRAPGAGAAPTSSSPTAIGP
jgi:hypothetical protein